MFAKNASYASKESWKKAPEPFNSLVFVKFYRCVQIMLSMQHKLVHSYLVVTLTILWAPYTLAQTEACFERQENGYVMRKPYKLQFGS